LLEIKPPGQFRHVHPKIMNCPKHNKLLACTLSLSLPGMAACFGIPDYLSKTFYKTFPVCIVHKYIKPLYSSYDDVM